MTSEIQKTQTNADHFPRELMTEYELIQFLRIPEVCGEAKPHNVLDNLKRNRGLPCIYISNKSLYPKKAVLEWIEANVEKRT